MSEIHIPEYVPSNEIISHKGSNFLFLRYRRKEKNVILSGK